MSGLLLTEAERIRFAEWLELQAETAKGMAHQMEKMSIMPAMIELEKRRIAAYLLVASGLRNTETMTVGDGK